MKLVEGGRRSFSLSIKFTVVASFAVIDFP